MNIKIWIIIGVFVGNIAWSLVLTLKKPVPDHSESISALIEKSELLKQSEKNMWDSLKVIGNNNKALQLRIDALAEEGAQAYKMMAKYEKELFVIKKNMVKTNYADSTKTSILNSLPK